MKKICLFMTAFFLFSASANADIICVKNKVAAQGSVVLNGKIKVVKKDSCPKGFSKLLSTDEFKGEKGDKGDTGAKGEKGDTGEKGLKGDPGTNGKDGNAAFFANVLPAGVTVTGYVKTVSMNEAANQQNTNFNVSTSVSLPMPSTVEINGDSIGTASECTGSVTNPTAPAGKVCVYTIHGNATVNPINLGSEYDQDECFAANENNTWTCPNCPYCPCVCTDESLNVVGNRGYSRQAFSVEGYDAPFEGVWAYTVPEAE